MSLVSSISALATRIAAEIKLVRSDLAPETTTNLSSTTVSSTKPWTAAISKAAILGLINDASGSATDRVWSASKSKTYADGLLATSGAIEAIQDVVGAFLTGGTYDDPNNVYNLPTAGSANGASAPLDAGLYGFGTAKTAAQNATALFAAVTAAGKRPICAASGRYLCENLVFTNEDIHFDMPGVTLVHPNGAANPLLYIERAHGNPVAVGPTRTVEWGPRAPGGISWSAKYTALDLTSGGYKNYRGGDLVHISSKDHYPWDWTANKYDIATQDPNKGTFQAEFLPIMAIGLKVDAITNGGAREQMMVQGSISQATGLVQSDILGNSVSGSAITATQQHITFSSVSGDFVNGDVLTRIAGGNPDGGSGTFASVGQAVGTVSGAPMLLVNKVLDYHYGRTTAAQAVAGTQTPVDTTGSVRIRIVDRTKVCIVKVNFDIDGVPGDQDAYLTVRQDTAKFRGVFMPQFEGRAFGSWTRAVVVTSCYMGRWRAVFDGLPNHAYLDQGGGAFGYGFECKSSSQGNVFEYVGRNLRHSFTTNPNPRTFATGDASYIDYGTPMDNTVQNSVGIATFTNTFDTHPGDLRTRFVNCVAISGGSGGRYNSDGGAQFATRGFGTQWINCRSFNSVEGINILGSEHDAGFDHTYEITNCTIDKFQSRGIYIVDSVSNRVTVVVDGGRIIGDGSPTNQQYQHEGIAVGKGVKLMLKGEVEIGGFNGWPIRFREAGSAGIQTEADIISAVFNYRTSTANAQGIRVDGTMAKANFAGISLLVPDGHGLGGLITNRGGNTQFRLGTDIQIFGTLATMPLPVFQVTSAAGSPGWSALPVLVAAAAGTDGKSAYQLAVDSGFTGTQTQWLASLKGADGAAGSQVWVDGVMVARLDISSAPPVQVLTLATDVTGFTANAQLADVAALQKTLAPGEYQVHGMVLYQMSTSGGGSLRIGLGGAGAAGASTTGTFVDQNTTASVKSGGVVNALATAGTTMVTTSGSANCSGTSAGTAAATLPYVIDGKLVVTTQGVLGIVAGLTTGATAVPTIKAGSYLAFTKVG